MYRIKQKIIGVSYNMHIETLAPATKKLLLSFNNVDFLKEYYLAEEPRLPFIMVIDNRLILIGLQKY